jgi:hypothetical protein
LLITPPPWLGKWITSVTMSFLCADCTLLAPAIPDQGRRGLNAAVYVLAGVRVALCMMPRISGSAPTRRSFWGIGRNIPSPGGACGDCGFYRSARAHGDRAFRWMW